MTTRFALRALPFLALTVLGTGCGTILGLGDFTEGSSTSTGSGGAGGMASTSSSSSTTGSTSGTGGAPTFCEPNKAASCYTGTPESQNKGACHDGMKVCSADGSQFGPCTGDVTPLLVDDCVNLVDANCDGIKSCACTAGASVDCYDGPGGTKDVGTCHGGKMTCAADGQSFGPCDLQVLPLGLDDCNTAVDDNCDGTVNDLCTCTPNTFASCYSGPAGTQDVGTCKAGTKLCNATGTGFAACAGDVVPAAIDDCNTALDENCDSVTNDLCTCTPGTALACYSGPAGTQGHGVCIGGMKTCNSDGTGYGACLGEVLPAATDDCNTPQDENCDSVVNDACACVANSVSSCYSGSVATQNVGACKNGTRTCNASGTGYSPCTGETLPAASDDCTTQADENCDGVVNDLCTCTPSTTAACYSGPAGTQGVGTCKPGSKTCNATGTAYGACVGEKVPAAIDDCNVALDENCDGVVDDLCTCAPGTATSCYTGPQGTQNKGICVAGTKTCNATGTAYGACTGQVLPAATDDCMTMADENCDGVVNDACTCVANSTASCYSGPASTLGVGICKSGTRTCNGSGTAYGPCVGEVDPQAVDNCATQLDENCDGTVNDLCTCAPGTNASCYTGPAGTVNVGFCKAGSKTCNATGTAYSACAGETTPAPEVCSAIGDENCDGVACSEALWSFLAGDASSQTISSTAVDASGNIIIAGTFDGTLKLLNKVAGTNVTLISAGGNDYFLAKLNSAGDVIWAKGFGSAGDNGSTIGVAVDASGNIAISGGLYLSANFGGGVISSANGNETLFVVKYNAAGTYTWAKTFTNTAAHAPAIAFDTIGDIYIGGRSIHAMTVGATTFADTGNYDAFVIKLTGAAGTPVWAKQYRESGAGNGSQEIFTLKLDAANNIFIGGQFDTSIFLGMNYVATTSGIAEYDGFLAKLDTLGTVSWARIFAGMASSGGDAVTSIAIDSSSNVVVTGNVATKADLGGGTISASGGSGYAFLAKYTNGGVYVNAKIFQLSGGVFPAASGSGVSTDQGDNIYVSGSARGNINLGGGLLTSGGGFDAFLAKFDSGFNPLWSKLFGDANDQAGSALVYDSSTSRLIVPGSVEGTVNFGTGLLTGSSTTTYDISLAKFYP